VIGTERGAGPTGFDGAVGRCFSAIGVEGTEAIVEGIIGDPTMVDGSGKDDARKAKLGALEDEGGERVGGLKEDMARVGIGVEEAGGGGCGCSTPVCGCGGDDGIDGDGDGIGVVDEDDAKTGFVCTGPVCARGLEVAAMVTGDAEELLANGDGMGGDEGPAGPARQLWPMPNGRLPSAVNADADADAGTDVDVDVDAKVDLTDIAPSDDRLAAMSIGGVTDRCSALSADPRDISRGCGLDDGAGEPAREPSREMGRTGRSGNGRTLGGGRCDLDRGLVVMVVLRLEGVDVEEEAAVKMEVGVVVRERDGRVGVGVAAEVEPEGEWAI
jgi:hypothetical protein